jgi:hypothetical protein
MPFFIVPNFIPKNGPNLGISILNSQFWENEIWEFPNLEKIPKNDRFLGNWENTDLGNHFLSLPKTVF